MCIFFFSRVLYNRLRYKRWNETNTLSNMLGSFSFFILLIRKSRNTYFTASIQLRTWISLFDVHIYSIEGSSHSSACECKVHVIHKASSEVIHKLFKINVKEKISGVWSFRNMTTMIFLLQIVCHILYF